MMNEDIFWKEISFLNDRISDLEKKVEDLEKEKTKNSYENITDSWFKEIKKNYQ